MLAICAQLRSILILQMKQESTPPQPRTFYLATLIIDVLLSNMTYDKFAENRIEDKHRVSVTGGLGGRASSVGIGCRPGLSWGPMLGGYHANLQGIQ